MFNQTMPLGRITEKGKVHAVYTNRNGKLLTDCISAPLDHIVNLTEPNESVLCGHCFTWRGLPWTTI